MAKCPSCGMQKYILQDGLTGLFVGEKQLERYSCDRCGYQCPREDFGG